MFEDKLDFRLVISFYNKLNDKRQRMNGACNNWDLSLDKSERVFNTQTYSEQFRKNHFVSSCQLDY